jgi:hypothetical protein
MKLKSKRIRNRRNPSHDEGSRLRRPSRVRRKPKKAEETGEEESSVAPQRRRVRRPVRSPASAAKKRGASRIRGKKKEKKEEEDTFGGATPDQLRAIRGYRQERREIARIQREMDLEAAPTDFAKFRKQKEPIDPGKGATREEKRAYADRRQRFLAKQRGEKMDISKLPIPTQVEIWKKMKKMDAGKLRNEEWDAIYKAGITTKEGQLLPFIKKRYQKL